MTHEHIHTGKRLILTASIHKLTVIRIGIIVFEYRVILAGMREKRSSKRVFEVIFINSQPSHVMIPKMIS
jgi:hypothetical protein